MRAAGGGAGAEACRVASLELSAVRSYPPAPTRIEFAPRLTVFLGPNGSGKTTVLEALRLGLGHGQAGQRPRQSYAEFVSNRQAPPFEARIRVALSGPGGAREEFGLALRAQAPRKPGGAALSVATRAEGERGPLAAAATSAPGLLNLCMLCPQADEYWMLDTQANMAASYNSLLSIQEYLKLAKDLRTAGGSAEKPGDEARLAGAESEVREGQRRLRALRDRRERARAVAEAAGGLLAARDEARGAGLPGALGRHAEQLRDLLRSPSVWSSGPVGPAGSVGPAGPGKPSEPAGPSAWLTLDLAQVSPEHAAGARRALEGWGPGGPDRPALRARLAEPSRSQARESLNAEAAELRARAATAEAGLQEARRPLEDLQRELGPSGTAFASTGETLAGLGRLAAILEPLVASRDGPCAPALDAEAFSGNETLRAFISDRLGPWRLTCEQGEKFIAVCKELRDFIVQLSLDGVSGDDAGRANALCAAVRAAAEPEAPPGGSDAAAAPAPPGSEPELGFFAAAGRALESVGKFREEVDRLRSRAAREVKQAAAGAERGKGKLRELERALAAHEEVGEVVGRLAGHVEDRERHSGELQAADSACEGLLERREALARRKDLASRALGLLDLGYLRDAVLSRAGEFSGAARVSREALAGVGRVSAREAAEHYSGAYKAVQKALQDLVQSHGGAGPLGGVCGRGKDGAFTAAQVREMGEEVWRGLRARGYASRGEGEGGPGDSGEAGEPGGPEELAPFPEALLRALDSRVLLSGNLGPAAEVMRRDFLVFLASPQFPEALGQEAPEAGPGLEALRRGLGRAAGLFFDRYSKEQLSGEDRVLEYYRDFVRFAREQGRHFARLDRYPDFAASLRKLDEISKSVDLARIFPAPGARGGPSGLLPRLAVLRENCLREGVGEAVVAHLDRLRGLVESVFRGFQTFPELVGARLAAEQGERGGAEDVFSELAELADAGAAAQGEIQGAITALEAEEAALETELQARVSAVREAKEALGRADGAAKDCLEAYERARCKTLSAGPGLPPARLQAMSGEAVERLRDAVQQGAERLRGELEGARAEARALEEELAASQRLRDAVEGLCEQISIIKVRGDHRWALSRAERAVRAVCRAQPVRATAGLNADLAALKKRHLALLLSVASRGILEPLVGIAECAQLAGASQLAAQASGALEAAARYDEATRQAGEEPSLAGGLEGEWRAVLCRAAGAAGTASAAAPAGPGAPTHFQAAEGLETELKEVLAQIVGALDRAGASGDSTLKIPVETFQIPLETLRTLARRAEALRAGLVALVEGAGGPDREIQFALSGRDVQKQEGAVRDLLQKTYARLYAGHVIRATATRYYELISRGVSAYRRDVVTRVNERLHELWTQTYRATGEYGDIQSVQLEAEGGEDESARLELRGLVRSKAGPVRLPLRDMASSGQRMMVSILVRLAFLYAFRSPLRLLALDEPTNFLDEENQRGLADALARFISADPGAQVVIITHSTLFLDALRTACESAGMTGYAFYDVFNGTARGAAQPAGPRRGGARGRGGRGPEAKQEARDGRDGQAGPAEYVGYTVLRRRG